MKLPTQRVVHDLGPIGTFLLASRTLVLQVTERDLLQVKRGIFLERKKKRGEGLPTAADLLSAAVFSGLFCYVLESIFFKFFLNFFKMFLKDLIEFGLELIWNQVQAVGRFAWKLEGVDLVSGLIFGKSFNPIGWLDGE